MIKHISFDFWDTLFEGNSNYRSERLKLLYEYLDSDPELIKLNISELKDYFDQLGESTMSCVDPKTQLWHLCSRLSTKVTVDIVTTIQRRLDDLFQSYPPHPLFDLTTLEDLKSKGLSLSISCNTGLISGKAVRQMLNTDLFDFQLYSDTLGYFKPNPFFAETILHHTHCKADSFEDIVHVGDNLNTDGKMCTLTGMKFLHIRNKNINIELLLNSL